MTALRLDQLVSYPSPQPGLHPRERGRVIALEDRVVVVKPRYPFDAPPIQVARSKVKPLKQRAAVATIVALSRPRAAQPLIVVAKLAPLLHAVPRSHGRIIDEDYLAWIRTLDCQGCESAQRSQTQAAHLGPRGVAQRTDDWRCNPLCYECHIEGWHGLGGALPGLSPSESRRLLLRGQIACLLRYFAQPLGPRAALWARCAGLADALPVDQQEDHLRLTLDLLIEQLRHLTRRLP